MSSDRMLAELLNRSKLLEYAVAQVEAATALGGRPAQRDALKTLYHTVQVFAIDLARLRAGAEEAGILTSGSGYNDGWLVVPEREEDVAVEAPGTPSLPVAIPAPASRQPASHAAHDITMNGHSGEEKILIVDPDEGTRALATAILREVGYRVHDARSGEEALAHLGGNPDEVHLLVTAHHLPGMSGGQLAESITAWHPRVRVLFTQADAPLRPSELAKRVREELATASGGAFSAA
jgi:CheY-like chemotaxis protein